MPGTVPPTVPSTMDVCARVAEWISALACSTIDRYPVESDGACACSRVCADGPPARMHLCLPACHGVCAGGMFLAFAFGRVRGCGVAHCACARDGSAG